MSHRALDLMHARPIHLKGYSARPITCEIENGKQHASCCWCREFSFGASQQTKVGAAQHTAALSSPLFLCLRPLFLQRLVDAEHNHSGNYTFKLRKGEPENGLGKRQKTTRVAVLRIFHTFLGRRGETVTCSAKDYSLQIVIFPWLPATSAVKLSVKYFVLNQIGWLVFAT